MAQGAGAESEGEASGRGGHRSQRGRRELFMEGRRADATAAGGEWGGGMLEGMRGSILRGADVDRDSREGGGGGGPGGGMKVGGGAAYARAASERTAEPS